MSLHPIADALESARIVLESGFPDSILLTDARTQKINELEQKIAKIEAKNTHLHYCLAHKNLQTMNIKDVYTKEILRLHNNLTAVSARLDAKTKDFENAVVENIKLGIEIGRQAATILEFNSQQRKGSSVLSQSQQLDEEKMTNISTQTPQPLTAQNFWNDFLGANKPDTPTLPQTPPTTEVDFQFTPPLPTEVAKRKRGRPKKIGPLNIVLPPAAKAIPGHSSVAVGQFGTPNVPMWPNQVPGTSGSYSSGHYDFLESNGNEAKKTKNVIYP